MEIKILTKFSFVLNCSMDSDDACAIEDEILEAPESVNDSLTAFSSRAGSPAEDPVPDGVSLGV